MKLSHSLDVINSIRFRLTVSLNYATFERKTTFHMCAISEHSTACIEYRFTSKRCSREIVFVM